MSDDWARWNYDKGVTYALEALKAAMLINGGAAVALLAFMGTYSGLASPKVTVKVAEVVTAFPRFAAGTGAAALALGLAYLAQFCFGARVEHGIPRNRPLFWLAEVFQGAALLAFGMSIWWFFRGVTIAGRSFS